MKKVLALMLAMVLVLSLAACGGNDTKESSTDKTSGIAEQSDTVKDTEQAPQENVDVPDSLVGTWYIMPNFSEGSMSASGSSVTILDEAEILSFTIIKNGTITVDGKEYPMKKSSDNNSLRAFQDYGEYNAAYTVNIGDDQYEIGINTDTDNSNYIVFQPFGNKVASYTPLYAKKNYTLKTAELTLDNWQDFFEVKSEYKLHKNDWDDFDGVYAAWYFGEKNDIIISDIQNARIAFKSSSTETSMIHFDKNTEEYTFSDAVTESNEPYESESDINIYNTEDSYHNIWVSIYDNYRFLPQKDFKDAGNEYTARVVTKVNVEVTRIMGTIIYLTEE